MREGFTPWRAQPRQCQEPGRLKSIATGAGLRGRGAGVDRQPLPDRAAAYAPAGRRRGSRAGNLSAAFRAADRFEPGTNLRAWLFTILHNTARNRVRDRARDAVTVDSEAVERAADGAGRSARSKRRRAALVRASMNPRCRRRSTNCPMTFRQAVWLRDVEEFSYAEIAGMLEDAHRDRDVAHFARPPDAVRAAAAPEARQCLSAPRPTAGRSIPWSRPTSTVSWASGDRERLGQHVGRCAPCRARVRAEQSIRDVLRQEHAATLPRACTARARGEMPRRSDAAKESRASSVRGPGQSGVRPARVGAPRPVCAGCDGRHRPDAYPLSGHGCVRAACMAAELAADHVKCVADEPRARHRSRARRWRTRRRRGGDRAVAGLYFAWNAHLPEAPAQAGLELVGSRHMPVTARARSRTSCIVTSATA